MDDVGMYSGFYIARKALKPLWDFGCTDPQVLRATVRIVVS